MAKSKSTGIDKSHGFVTTPTPMPEQGTPINGGNDHGRLKSSSQKLKSGRPKDLNQPKKDK